LQPPRGDEIWCRTVDDLSGARNAGRTQCLFESPEPVLRAFGPNQDQVGRRQADQMSGSDPIQGSPHGVSKIVRQQSFLVGKTFRCRIEKDLHTRNSRNSSAEAEAGSNIRFCNSLTFRISRFSIRFWTNRVVTLGMGEIAASVGLVEHVHRRVGIG
jgi:hypothetical protein